MNEAPPTTELSPKEAAERIEQGAKLLDVRTDEEWDTSRIPGATHVPLTELAAYADELAPADELVIYCRVGNRSAVASDALSGAGFNANNLAGGIKAWAEAGLEIEPADGEIA